MKLIKPKQISGEIMTLLDEADKEVNIISPYIKVSQWKKLENTFDKLKERNVLVKFFYRQDETRTHEEIKKLGFAAFPIEKLHCKIYLNENYGIVSSMNLYKFSDENSLDIAYKTETKEEFTELKEFYKRYIEKNSKEKFISINDFLEKLDIELSYKLNEEYFDIQPDFHKKQINIKTSSNNYWFGFQNEGESNLFWINGIITSQQYDYATHIGNQFSKKYNLNVELISSEDTNGYNNVAYEDVNDIRTFSIDKINKVDADRIIPIISKFIERTEAFRDIFGKISHKSW